MNSPLISAPRVSPELTAAELAQLAVAAHQRTCRECGNPTGDTWCPVGERYLAAVQPDRSWIAAYGGT